MKVNEDHIIYESPNVIYYHTSKKVMKIDKKSKNETKIYTCKSSLKTLEDCKEKCVFYGGNELFYVNPKTERLSVKELKGIILKCKLLKNLIIVLTILPTTLNVLEMLDDLLIISQKSIKELGLVKPVLHSPKMDFDVFEGPGGIIVTYKRYADIFDFKLNKLIRFAHSYPRTFLTALEKGFEELNLFSTPNMLNIINTKDALKVLNLNSSFKEEDLKKRYRELIRKYHPDINPSKEATKKTSKIIAAYNVLKYQSVPDKKKPELNEKVKESKIDWFSIVKVLDERIYFGTYSGRVIGIVLQRLIEQLKSSRNEALIITDLIFYQDFYFKPPDNEISPVYDIRQDKDSLIIETSTYPFTRKGGLPLPGHTYRTFKVKLN